MAQFIDLLEPLAIASKIISTPQSAASAFGSLLNFTSAQDQFNNVQKLQQNQFDFNVSNAQLGFQNAAQMQQNQFDENTFNNREQFDFASQLQQNQFDENTYNNREQFEFTSGQNDLNRAQAVTLLNTQQQNNLALQAQGFSNNQIMQKNAFSNLQQLQSDNLSASFARGALNEGANLLNSGIGAAINFGLQSNAAALQRQNFDYMTGKAASAYSSAGLPSWMAFSGSNAMSNASNLPLTTQVVSGMNSMTSKLPGDPMSTPWTGTSSQSAFGWGDVPTAF